MICSGISGLLFEGVPSVWGSGEISRAFYMIRENINLFKNKTSKQGGFSIYIFDNSKSKSMVRSEKMALCGLVFARKIARMILIQNIKGLMGP